MVSDHRVDRALELLVPVADEVPHPQELTCRPQRLELFVGVEHEGRRRRPSGVP